MSGLAFHVGLANGVNALLYRDLTKAKHRKEEFNRNLLKHMKELVKKLRKIKTLLKLQELKL
jgi:hypothetical protein